MEYQLGLANSDSYGAQCARGLPLPHQLIDNPRALYLTASRAASGMPPGKAWPEKPIDTASQTDDFVTRKVRNPHAD